MTKSTIFFSIMSLSSIGFARQPKAALCAPQALKAATALYLLNNADSVSLRTDLDLIEMSHGEGGHEVWDVRFTEVGTSSSPYRIKVVTDGCVVYSFSMPTAG